VNNPRARLAKLLDSKLRLFEKMEIFLIEQKHLLEERNFDAFRERSDNVDIIIGRIKDIDYDLARCESNDDEIAELINSNKDGEIQARLREAVKIAERNHDLMDEVSARLKSLKGELKGAPGKNIEAAGLGGYKPVNHPSPAWFDKTS
jgi:hypothetical protein